MNYGYTTPDGIMYSIDYEIAYFKLDDQLVNRRLHDSEGKLFLNENEEVIEDFLSPFDFCHNWSRFVTPIFEYLGGDARIILTNQRLVALRIASPEQALTGLSLYNLPIAIGKYISTKKKKSMQIREYLEIPLDEIDAVSTQIGDILIFYDLYPYRLFLGVDNYKKIVDYLANKEFIRVIKGRGKKKWNIIYYKDPTSYQLLWKSKNVYEQRRLIIQVAKGYLKKGKLKKAIKQYNKAIKLIPDDKFSKKQIEMLQKQCNSQ